MAKSCLWCGLFIPKKAWHENVDSVKAIVTAATECEDKIELLNTRNKDNNTALTYAVQTAGGTNVQCECPDTTTHDAWGSANASIESRRVLAGGMWEKKQEGVSPIWAHCTMEAQDLGIPSRSRIRPGWQRSRISGQWIFGVDLWSQVTTLSENHQEFLVREADLEKKYAVRKQGGIVYGTIDFMTICNSCANLKNWTNDYARI